MGEVVAIFYAKENTEKQDQLIVSFDGIEVTYNRPDLSQITHAYCCSVHKSQGSEFPIVVLPVVKSYYRMLRRNLIYTAITRSKQFLILVGEEDALKMGIERGDDTERNTTLVEMLVHMLPELNGDPDIKVESHQVVENKVAPAEVKKASNENDYLKMVSSADPLIGMGNLTPYDFMAEGR
jgi:exodeoxyribonuclease V alpha subunit